MKYYPPLFGVAFFMTICDSSETGRTSGVVEGVL